MDSFVIQPDGVVAVSYVDPSPLVSVEVLQPASVGVVTVLGPQGPPGEPGPAYESPAWWFDDGPPNSIVGAKPGDLYMDVSTGTIYRLGD